MPLYEFECRNCERVFEELCAVGAAKKPPCPDCGSRKVSKVMSTFAMRSPGGNGGTRAGGCGGCSSRKCSTCH